MFVDVRAVVNVTDRQLFLSQRVANERRDAGLSALSLSERGFEPLTEKTNEKVKFKQTRASCTQQFVF